MSDRLSDPGRGRDAEVTVVVVTWQRRDLTADCLRSLEAQTLAHRVLVVDNASTDGTAAMLAECFPGVEVLALATNTGFAGGVSAALEVVQTRFVALLNNDAQAEPGWLEASTRALLEHPEAAAATARMLLDPLGRADAGPDTSPEKGEGGAPLVNNCGVVLLASGYGADRGLGEPDGSRFDQPATVFGFSGGAAVLRTLAVKAVGGFDAGYFMYYEDTDLSWRLQLAGWSVVYCPDAVVHHLHASSSDPVSAMFAFHTERNRLLMLLTDAPRGFALACLARFVVTTLSLTARPHRPDPSGGVRPLVLDPRLRVRVLGAVLTALPGVSAKRRRSPRVRGRAAVLSAWRGVPARVLEEG